MTSDIDMDVDSLSVREHAKDTRGDPVKATLDAVQRGLQPFICRCLKHALGDDMYEPFAPPVHASPRQLLRTVQARWIGVFSDSALSGHKDDVQALRDLLDSLPRAPTAVNVPAKTVERLMRDAEAFLVTIGNSTLAAQVGQLRVQGPANASPIIHAVGEQRKKSTAPSSLAVDVEDGQSMDVEPTVALQSTSPPQVVPVASLPGTAAVKMPVVLDGSNISWKHGCSKRFSIRGAAEALQFFVTRGHPTVLFLPEARLRDRPRTEFAAEDTAAFEAIKSLEGSDMLVLTPDRDYDDAYLTHFARQHRAVVVSNDAFADQVYQASADGLNPAAAWKRWLSACRLPFTFQSHAFLPNPSFDFDKARRVAADLALPP